MGIADLFAGGAIFLAVGLLGAGDCLVASPSDVLLLMFFFCMFAGDGSWLVCITHGFFE